jgi:hypothetical protein
MTMMTHEKTKEAKKVTKDLERTVEVSDRRYRFWHGVFMIVVVAALFGLLSFAIKSAEQAGTQLTQQKVLLEQQRASTDELKRNTTEQLDRQERYIRCIAEIFASHQGGTVKIEDLDTCSVSERQVTSTATPSSTPRTAQTSTTPTQPGQSAAPSPQPETENPQGPPPGILEQLFDRGLTWLGL